MNSQRRDERRFSNTARRRFALVAAALLLVLPAGCRSGCEVDLSGLFFGPKEKWPGEQYEGQYFKEGYGFNNPNAEKMKDPAYRKSLAP